MNANVLSFVIPLIISLYGLFMPPVQYVNESLTPTLSIYQNDEVHKKFIKIYYDRNETDWQSQKPVMSNYRILSLLWLVLTLTMLLYPVRLWIRLAFWNLVGIAALLAVMLIATLPYGELLGKESLLISPFFLVPLGLNLAIALGMILWLRLSDSGLLDAIFTGFFPWLMIYYPVFVALAHWFISTFFKELDLHHAPNFRWLFAQSVVFWAVWIVYMYNRIIEYELPVGFKRALDDDDFYD